MGAHLTTRGDHTLNVRMLRFRGAADREEPAMLALDLVSRGRFLDAAQVVEAALEAAPEDAELAFALGRARLGAGALEAAQELFTRAARLERAWDEPYTWLARTLELRGRRRKAAELAERAVELGAEDDDVRALAREARVHRALSERLETFRRTPEREEPAMLALAFLEVGRVEDAREVVTSALCREPGDEDLVALAARVAPPPTEAALAEVEGLLATIEAAPRDTVVGEPAPRLHAPKKRSGWLPRLGARRPAAAATARVPFAMRRDPTIRFLVAQKARV